MNRRSILLGLVGFSFAGCRSPGDGQDPPQPEGAAKIMMLTSPAFQSNGLIPARYTCDGNNTSPPLQWEAPPAGTRSLALMMDDPDAPSGTFLHWIAYDLPADLRQLPEGLPAQAKLSNGGIQANNDFGKPGYGGPCPPGGVHRYVFKLYGLDRTIAPAQITTRDQFLAAIKGHILASGELVGRYRRQG
ncbi:MAG: YbhB/YbcL family Raf kinase inhibitor-like protein [Kovacikia sp.]